MDSSGELPPLPSPEELTGDQAMGGVSRSGDPFKDNPQLAQMLEDRIDMHDAYCQTFVDSRFGKKVLKHLKMLHCFEGEALYSPDDKTEHTAFKLGQRYVIESIKHFLDQAPDEMKEHVMAIEERRHQIGRNPSW